MAHRVAESPITSGPFHRPRSLSPAWSYRSWRERQWDIVIASEPWPAFVNNRFDGKYLQAFSSVSSVTASGWRWLLVANGNKVIHAQKVTIDSLLATTVKLVGLFVSTDLARALSTGAYDGLQITEVKRQIV